MPAVTRQQSYESYGITWLVVAEGGWWKASEIADALGVEVRSIHQRLANMVGDGYLARRHIPVAQRELGKGSGARERAQYAVGPGCFIPRGLSAASVAKALGVPRQADHFPGGEG